MKKLKQTDVDLSWKRFLLPPIHPEGAKILGIVFAIVVLLGLLSNFFWIIGIPMLLFTFYFFRNPTRVSPTEKGLILAPADGIVSKIEEVVPPEALGMPKEPLTRVSTFMSLFSVHVNRAPISGTVVKLNYHPGPFMNVADKDSDENERQEILMESDQGTKVAFTQIAGLVARRIYCPLHVGQKLTAGHVFGMIRFGSRLDVYLPKGVVPMVKPGQTMIAGETIIAKLKEKNND